MNKSARCPYCKKRIKFDECDFTTCPYCKGEVVYSLRIYPKPERGMFTKKRKEV